MQILNYQFDQVSYEKTGKRFYSTNNKWCVIRLTDTTLRSEVLKITELNERHSFLTVNVLRSSLMHQKRTRALFSF